MIPPARLALVLHAHMPYVEGFGVWPFGEEWLLEAMATVYGPLAELLEQEELGAQVTLSVTPVLADQLLAPGLEERYEAFLGELRPLSHELDAAELGGAAGAELTRAAGDYARALERQRAHGAGGLGRALLDHAAWTSSATHAVLPLLATDAGVRLQVHTGVASHRARTAGWHGGFWLPECAHAPWLEPVLEEAGVHATCVDLTDVHGPGSPEHLRPQATAAGPLLVPIDRATLELVWSDGGYPAAAPYRAYTHRSTRDHHPWAVDGAVYDPARAAAQVQADAADFVARVGRRIAGGGLCTVAMDAELLGHWWYEGVDWLRAVLRGCAREGVAVVHLDDAVREVDPAPPRALPVTTWGRPRDLSTWDGPRVADLAWAARRAELDVVAAGTRADLRAVRELLALQASDWAFLETNDSSGPYPRERLAGHEAALRAALAAPGTLGPEVRSLVPAASVAPLLTP